MPTIGLISFILFSILSVSATQASAVGSIDVQVAPAWWQYKEKSPQLAGFTATPLQSKSSGIGIEASITATLHLKDGKWIVQLSNTGLLSTGHATEHWNINPTSIQTNQLKIAQNELKLTVNKKAFGAYMGLWASYQWHRQQRKNFIANGILQPIGRVNETVNTGWVGISLESTSVQGATIKLESGLPVWTKVTNDLVLGAFHRRTGYRVGVHARMLMPWTSKDIQYHLLADYQYRKLGGETIANKWLWPENQWQTISLGASVTW